MKILASTKCSLKSLTKKKREKLTEISVEFRRLVNCYIKNLWGTNLANKDLLKPFIDLVDSEYGFRFKKEAARYAVSIVSSVYILQEQRKLDILKRIKSLSKSIKREKIAKKKNLLCLKLKKFKNKLANLKPARPKYSKLTMPLSSATCVFNLSKTKAFDAWIQLRCISKKLKLFIPLKLHKHINDLMAKGRLLQSFTFTNKEVAFTFEIELGPKKEVTKVIGIDKGICSLVTTSEGFHYGTDIQNIVDRLHRAKSGSKNQKRHRRHLKQTICEVAKQVVQSTDMLIMGDLSFDISKTSLGSKRLRKAIGSWGYSFLDERLRYGCEANRVSYRKIKSFYTSQECPHCGNIDRRNRLSQNVFRCQKCNHTDNADENAAINILNRFIKGKYGSFFKEQVVYKCSTIDKGCVVYLDD